jgi:hypothetical protein
MKVKAIVSLLALAAAGSSFAAINTAQGTSEVFFMAYDKVNQTQSFVFDTGLSATSLIDGTINGSFNIGADANWASFVSAVGGLSNIGWAVEAVQNSSTVPNKFVYATIGAGATAGPAGTNQSFNGSFGSFYTAVGNTTISAGQSEVDAAGTAAYLGNSAAAAKAFDGFAAANVSSFTNAVGTTGVVFFGEALSSFTKSLNKATLLATPTAVAGFAAGTLTIGTPVITPSVPEPSSYALALVALAGMGFVARRRAK